MTYYALFPRDYYNFLGILLLRLFEFDKNANSLNISAIMLVVLIWFGDYRGLRFFATASVVALFYFRRNLYGFFKKSYQI